MVADLLNAISDMAGAGVSPDLFTVFSSEFLPTFLSW
jgi:hypothetical protein